MTSAAHGSQEDALLSELVAARALIVRYWCGDGPEGSGAQAEILDHIGNLPRPERTALFKAIADPDLLDAWMRRMKRAS